MHLMAYGQVNLYCYKQNPPRLHQHTRHRFVLHLRCSNYQAYFVRSYFLDYSWQIVTYHPPIQQSLADAKALPYQLEYF